MWHVVTSYGTEYCELDVYEQSMVRLQFRLKREEVSETVLTHIQFRWIP